MMKRILLLILTAAPISGVLAQKGDSLQIRKIVNEALLNGKCYSDLKFLANEIGGRLSGSEEADRAVLYMYSKMREYNFDTVWLQPVMVPHWVRGEKEQAYASRGNLKTELNVCALGNSVGTGDKGLRAPVVEVKTADELDLLGKNGVLKGKIVFFNAPLNSAHIHTGTAYGESGWQRTKGPAMASRYGAVGALVRSLTLALDEFPHTGATQYNDSFPHIPACAISTIHANELSALLKVASTAETQVYMRTTCQMLPDEQSYNVIGEIRGSEKPSEVILVGGHLDSWDNGDGAHDDGAGCVQSVETLRIFKSLGIKPKRTIRCVLFMNEENGLRGGLKYAEWAGMRSEKHVAALESDAGGFTPRGFNTTATGTAMAKLTAWQSLLKPYGIETLKHPGGGADIGPLGKYGTVLIGFIPDSQRYFDYHHTQVDTFDKVNKRELELGAACITSLIWLISEYGL
ncbi:MAG: M28 family peptidase [Bacteroidota bacterium]